MPVEHLSRGNDDGTTFGQNSADKISFFGATPVVQPATQTAPAATAATNSSPYGFSQAQADALIAWVRAADTALKNLGIIAAS